MTMMCDDELDELPVDPELEAMMRYDPLVDRVFDFDGDDRLLTLGHECNSPITMLWCLAECVCHSERALF
jgi:hypothetical protein